MTNKPYNQLLQPKILYASSYLSTYFKPKFFMHLQLREQFFLSNTLFCCGKYEIVKGQRISWFLYSNFLDVNLSSLLNLITFIFWPLFFNKYFKFIKSTKYFKFKFFLQKIYPKFSTKIINEKKNRFILNKRV